MHNQYAMESLHRSLQALAQPGENQLHLFPDFVCKADELALDYDYSWEYAHSQDAGSFTEIQVELLNTINSFLDEMSGEDNAALWTDEALLSHPIWAGVREMAKQALDALNWSSEPPLPNPNTIYYQAAI